MSEHCHRVMKNKTLFEAIRHQQDPALRPGSNATRVPDQMLSAFTPVLVIRNPALAVPSFYAGMARLNLAFEPTGEDMLLQTSLRYCRMIFDYYYSTTGDLPVVVDGEDITWRSDEIGSKLCDALNLDGSGLQDEWDPTPDTERPSNPYIWAFTKDMHESTGIRRSDAPVSSKAFVRRFEIIR